MNLQELRVAFFMLFRPHVLFRGALRRDQLLEDPVEQFRQWYGKASKRFGVYFPTAMSLSTVDTNGRPNSRMVLLKDFDERGFVFYTNYNSGKGEELEANPSAALSFYWDSDIRQVRVRGTVEHVSPAEANDYFRTRPRGSQLGAWASRQSSTLESRDSLRDAVAAVAKEYQGKPVPRPEHWGGYRLVPYSFEFWQAGKDRLHDRFRYSKTAEGGWAIERLSP